MLTVHKPSAHERKKEASVYLGVRELPFFFLNGGSLVNGHGTFDGEK